MEEACLLIPGQGSLAILLLIKGNSNKLRQRGRVNVRRIKVLREPRGLTWDEIATLKNKLAEILPSAPVLLVYLFGSAARNLTAGKQGKLSDIDLAVLLAHEAQGASGPEELLNLLEIFSKVFGREDIDLTILNTSPPVIKGRVLQEGILLYTRDRQARLDFEIRARREYLDTQPLRAFYQRQFVAKIKKGEAGRGFRAGLEAPQEARRIREFLKGISKREP
ncbi:type VII toxin-antitoxin system MntA family adenylyltransferase antitoxin [Neomoorella thermoacetica]|uniref:type VII toxin-antitoxin system MntA family adenylyltransferase antitoxin n=1 Tax=Neomoorella thermoacetica TaxID=1525 RepID=UPI0030D58283